MKVLLIQSYLKGDNQPPVYPLGISYIATFLVKHEVKAFDPNVSDKPMDDLSNIIAEFKPDVIGISFRNIDNQSRIKPLDYYGDFRKILGIVKKGKPSALIIVGGAGFSMMAEEIMEANKEIDFGIYLEGEETFPELLDNLLEPQKVKGVFYRKGGKVFFTGSRLFADFGKYPQPRRDLLDIKKYRGEVSIGIQTQRGCPLRCAYCNYPALNGNMLRIRRPSDVVDEIESLVERYNVKQFVFADSIFNRPHEHAVNICQEIIRRGLHKKANWVCWLDLRYMTKDFLSLAEKAGCNGICFSPDGLSDSSLRSLNKGIREKDVWNILKLVVGNSAFKKMTCIISMFINTPGETPFGVLRIMLYKVISILIKIVLRRKVNVYTGWIRLEPSTELYKMAIEQGVISCNKPLLQSDQNDIKTLFYLNPSLRKTDKVILEIVYYKILLKEKIKKLIRRGI